MPPLLSIPSWDLEGAFRIDVLVENAVIVEIKATTEINQVHKSQVITYLKLTNRRLGFLINFNTALLKQGITRIVR